ncbi:Cysteine protease atg4 [Blastomyces dermatitidis]|uniref:Cysteine protease n=2 Tax=Ajellomyces dermatitidis TaxID=5039 RepID=F2TAI7_AJEDA|nr:autophagy-like protein 4 [Blastomyces dermatitidis ER-3]EEQ91369.1 autophagy-like protein 4 [Blastomyces dermatitidis ER-3]EGE80250.1 autophagy-like protein 4 [Blastomyces dermatitidis ATCC 18188]EQL28521.1 autophagy-like protein 4 [Blastomyces dermatitidis ATCC 26199]
MNNVDIGKYKRIVQYFWDPEPKNDDEPGSPIWCLGRVYQPLTPPQPQPQPQSPQTQEDDNKTRDEHRNDSDQTTNAVATRPPDNGPRLNSQVPLFANHHGSTTANPPGQQGQQDWPAAFLDDFESKIWLTYRSSFPLIPKSSDPNAASAMTLGVRLRSQLVDPQGFTTDTGWGCMIRSGQSLLANALAILFLGREWRRGTKVKEESNLLSLFADDPRAPFSIHRFVEHGASACGKYPGEWFGPSATARCIQALSSECKHAGLNVYVTSDGSDVYEDRFRAIASGGGTGTSTDIRPTLILLGIRLGIDRVTPVYWEALKAVLKYPQAVGIAGGRPSSSHYFIGAQGSHFFYLDPHHTRPALPYHVPVDQQYTDEELNTYHTRRLRRLHIKDMDPSMLIGFLIRDEDDWDNWKRNVRGGAVTGNGKAIIHVFDKETSPFGGHGSEREGAVDEVEALDEYDDDDDECDDCDERVDGDERSIRDDDVGDSPSVLHISK